MLANLTMKFRRSSVKESIPHLDATVASPQRTKKAKSLDATGKLNLADFSAGSNSPFKPSSDNTMKMTSSSSNATMNLAATNNKMNFTMSSSTSTSSSASSSESKEVAKYATLSKKPIQIGNLDIPVSDNEPPVTVVAVGRKVDSMIGQVYEEEDTMQAAKVNRLIRKTPAARTSEAAEAKVEVKQTLAAPIVVNRRGADPLNETMRSSMNRTYKRKSLDYVMPSPELIESSPEKPELPEWDVKKATGFSSEEGDVYKQSGVGTLIGSKRKGNRRVKSMSKAAEALMSPPANN